MLNDFVKPAIPEKEEMKALLKAARKELGGYQMKIKEAKLPVMVIFEGWGAAGKGSVLGKVIRNIDPRFFKTKKMDAPTDEEKRYPFLYRYLLEIPEAGKFTFYDTYWMEEVTNGVFNGDLDEEAYKQRIKSINTMERSLHDNGYLVLKFFFHISKKEQKR
ncbi:MAG: phosphate--AMP phosphotransferase, partial [Eubacterium sp.]|nr:phosphate--AMP phosphotransferase [Eubacterium sp.]